MKFVRSLLCLSFVVAALAACGNQPDTAPPAPIPGSTGLTGATGMATGTGLSGGTGTPSSPAGTGGAMQ